MLQQHKLLLNSSVLLCVSVGFLLFNVVVSQIPLGSKLSVVENKFWVSSNGDFALGFFNHSDLPNQFSIGIRFNSKLIPPDKQTVVWVAGAEITVSNESYFQFTQNGELFLYDSLRGASAWTSKTSQLSVASAFLRDDGNLVLLNDKEDIVWQSFDTPSDTLLPGQILSVNKTLRGTSRTSVSSYYTLRFNASGHLQLRWESDIIYWTSESPAHSNLSAVLSSDGALQLLDRSSNPIWSVYGEDHNDTVKFRLLRLDADGNLRIYSWVDDSKFWRSVWQAIENQCNVFATCGEHGICVFKASGSPECLCPYRLGRESNLKCLLPFKEECKTNSNMIVYDHTYLYGIYPANDLFFQVSLQQCKALCQDDPSCTAVTFTNDGSAQCKMKTTRYVTGYSDPSLNSLSFVKTCSDPLAVDPEVLIHSPHKESHKLCVPYLLGAAAVTFIVFIVIQFGIGFYICRRRISARKKAALAFRNSKGLVIFSFEEIRDITGSFKHQTGPTTFGGTLHSDQPVTIKTLDTSIEERKFRNVVLKIGNIHHKNLVKLRGYCCEFGNRYLVYEYARNGSVKNYIEDCKLSKRLTWQKRVEICLSVARAICYLHTECREFVSHGNLKCENVVLDEIFEAKLTEFGLRMMEEDGASAEKDVEDFGKMVLILLSGCPEAEDVCEWGYQEWIEGRAEGIVDKRIDGEVDLEELERMLRIAFWCLQSNIHMRPSMAEVVKVLEGTLTVDPPPPPFACGRPPEQDDSLESSSEL